MACTTVLVGKNASYDGSTLVARNEDSPSGQFMPKKYVVVHPKEQPKKYKSVISKVEIDLPKKSMRYTANPNALDHEGIWGAFGVNEANVSMTATETITSNERVQSADPLVKHIPAKGKEGDKDYVPEKVGGIGEEDMVTLVLPYIKSAREGVERLGSILEEFGTYEMNGIAFQDEDEIWWLETIGGHHWIAKRVPDDEYVVMPNQLGIDNFDLEDALGEQKEHMCSSDLKEFIDENHLDLSLDEYLNPRDCFGSHADSDHVYNTPRAWIIQRFFNRNSNAWDGDYADYRPDSDDIPWSRVPEKKITVEDIKYVLSHHYQGTPYDAYSPHSDPRLRGMFRAIGVNRTNVLGLVQIRPYMPKEAKCVEWIAYGSNVFNAMIPFYSNIDNTPEYMRNPTATPSTDSFYWANRLIGVMADAQYAKNGSNIERYQLAAQGKSLEIMKKYDKQFKEGNIKGKKAVALSEQANQEIADQLKELTNDTLGKVLYESSLYMKNSFSRSDA